LQRLSIFSRSFYSERKPFLRPHFTSTGHAKQIILEIKLIFLARLYCEGSSIYLPGPKNEKYLNKQMEKETL
jgi:hypothetical protein